MRALAAFRMDQLRLPTAPASLASVPVLPASCSPSCVADNRAAAGEDGDAGAPGIRLGDLLLGPRGALFGLHQRDALDDEPPRRLVRRGLAGLLADALDDGDDVRVADSNVLHRDNRRRVHGWNFNT